MTRYVFCQINYGPNNELYSLRERCFFLTDKGYQYEVSG